MLYRLNTVEVHLPPLRDRPEDILALSDAFLQDIAVSCGCRPRHLTTSARDVLLRYEWPGNVRQLRNVLERAAIVCENELISPEHIVLGPAPQLRPDPIATTDLETFERKTIRQVLEDTRWNKSRAARRLGLSRTQLYGRMKRYGLDGSTPSTPDGSEHHRTCAGE